MGSCEREHPRIEFDAGPCPLCSFREVSAEAAGWPEIRGLLAQARTLRPGAPQPPPPQGRPFADVKLGVVIPVRTRCGMVERCIAALESQSFPPERVVVVWAGPGSAPRVSGVSGAIDVVVAPQESWCKGEAINAGLRQLRLCTHAVLLDADIILRDDALAWIARQIGEGYSAVALAPRDIPNPDDGEVLHFEAAAAGSRYRGPDQVGGCVAYPLPWLLASGGMSESYRGKGYHDLDLWQRAKRDLPSTLAYEEGPPVRALHRRHPVEIDEEQLDANRRLFEARWGPVARQVDRDPVEAAASATLLAMLRLGGAELAPSPGLAPDRIAVAITTYNRPGPLLDLLLDLAQSPEIAEVVVLDDGSTEDYSAARMVIDARGWTWVARDSGHGGKPGYAALVRSAMLHLSGWDATAYALLQDDLRLCEDFGARALAAWHSIDDPARGTMLLFRPEVPSRPGRWDYSACERVGESVRVQTWDCISMMSAEAVDAAAGMDLPNQGRWDADPGLASGVDLCVMPRLQAAGLSSFVVLRSLVWHRDDLPSVLNPAVRAEHPIYSADFVDGEAPPALRRALYVGAHDANAGWGSEAAIGRALGEHVDLHLVDYRRDPEGLLATLDRQWDAVFVQHGGGLGAAALAQFARHRVLFFASEADRGRVAEHIAFIRAVRPEFVLAHDPAVEAECRRLGVPCRLMLNGFDPAVYQSRGEPGRRPADVAFVGHMTGRRRRLLAAIRAMLPGTSWFIESGLGGAETAAAYNLARVVLHVHAGPEIYVPTRLFEAAATAAAVVVEHMGRDVDEIPAPVFARDDATGAALIIDRLLRDDRWREVAQEQAIAARNHTWGARVESDIWPALAATMVGKPREGTARPPTVDVILTVYRRDTLAEQLDAIAAQSLRPGRVTVWQNGSHVDIATELATVPGVQHIHASQNARFHGRFAAALLGDGDGKADGEYVAIFDDDCIPGPGWLRAAIRCSQERGAVVGANGRIYDPHTLAQTDIGGGQPVAQDTEVDFVGHCWVLRREWLAAMWAERPPTWMNGEDIHLAAALQIQRGIPCYVPAQPADDRRCWGDTDPGLGADDVATYRTADHRPLRMDLIRQWRARGWRLLGERG